MAQAKKKNICSDQDDLFARYKRDIIQIQVQAKNGGQTKLLNLDTISKQIKLDKSVIVKNMQKSLGVKIRPDDTTNAKLTVDQLEDELDKIIAKRVLCKTCGLPELDRDNCKACGSKHK